MEKVKVNLQYCYGIKKLDYEFDFSKKSIFSIYAPNGVMKTSFAKTMNDLCEGVETKDLMFPDRESIRDITDKSGNKLDKNDIYVIPPYKDQFSFDKQTTLLVNKELKEKYDEIHKNIDIEKENLIKKLKQLSGLTGKETSVESELSLSFNNKKFFDIIEELEEKIINHEINNFSSITYNQIFNEKVLSFLETGDFKKDISDYIDKYNDLVEKSDFLKKDFNHYHASTIQKSLKDNGFFSAEHTVNLFDGKEKKEVFSENELDTIFNKEKEKILSDKVLKDKFEKIDKKLSNAELRKFRDYLFDNRDLIPELVNLENLRKKIWITYLYDEIDLFNNLLKAYKCGKIEIEAIINQAKEEKGKWHNVVEIFNKRFFVPFQLEVSNAEDVILKSYVPSIKFIFKDGEDNKKAEQKELLEVLSQGERRALYILNIIFDVEDRKNNAKKTLFIVDDIADSFDYKNKYAIIEYLKEISEVDYFYQIILTHNFDFYRTISSRLDIGRKNRLNTIKTDTDILLKEEKYQKNPFETWKNQLDVDKKMLIASIPFVRNLSEYCGYIVEFEKLTSLLHIKSDSMLFTVKDLEDVYKAILKDKPNLILSDHSKLIMELIHDLAEEIINISDQEIELESKIVLAIAIRLKMEEFLIKEINDNTFVSSITKDQSRKLIEKYIKDNPTKNEIIKLIEKVNLMTPEGIHINSFMYEPIIDMSNLHLKQLYQEVKTL